VIRDFAARLRAVSELYDLCARLPHLPTPRERALLARFDVLTAFPASVTPADADALAAGWRSWWRAGRVRDIAAMATAIPRGVIDGDHRVATYVVAAIASVESKEST
jgi:hypothetical protein